MDLERTGALPLPRPYLRVIWVMVVFQVVVVPMLSVVAVMVVVRVVRLPRQPLHAVAPALDLWGWK